MNKVPFPATTFFNILPQLINAPDSQISESVRTKLKLITSDSDQELFDTLVEISKLPLTEISSFVRELFKLEPYYIRPKC